MIDHLLTTEEIDIAWRLSSAVLSGAIIGLNRFLKHKAAGMRTHAVTALSTALATIVALQIGNFDSASRVMQGLLTGVGFIGAGVIMRDSETHVQGLTTAATIWICAAIGIACGAGKIGIAVVVVIITLGVLLLGRPLERFVARLVNDQNAANDKND